MGAELAVGHEPTRGQMRQEDRVPGAGWSHTVSPRISRPGPLTRPARAKPPTPNCHREGQPGQDHQPGGPDARRLVATPVDGEGVAPSAGRFPGGRRKRIGRTAGASVVWEFCWMVLHLPPPVAMPSPGNPSGRSLEGSSSWTASRKPVTWAGSVESRGTELDLVVIVRSEFERSRRERAAGTSRVPKKSSAGTDRAHGLLPAWLRSAMSHFIIRPKLGSSWELRRGRPARSSSRRCSGACGPTGPPRPRSS